MDDRPLSVNRGIRTDYGEVSGPYASFIGSYVRCFRNGFSGVGKVVHADHYGVRLLPCTVNVGDRGESRLRVNYDEKMATFVPAEGGIHVEVLFTNDEEGESYLERIVTAFNAVEAREKAEKKSE